MSKNEKRSYYIIHTGFVQTFGSTTPILFPDFFLKQKLLFQDSVRTLYETLNFSTDEYRSEK